MPTFTETAKATKKKREIKLVGVDMYIITEKGIPKFDDIGAFKCDIYFESRHEGLAWVCEP